MRNVLQAEGTSVPRLALRWQEAHGPGREKGEGAPAKRGTRQATPGSARGRRECRGAAAAGSGASAPACRPPRTRPNTHGSWSLVPFSEWPRAKGSSAPRPSSAQRAAAWRPREAPDVRPVVKGCPLRVRLEGHGNAHVQVRPRGQVVPRPRRGVPLAADVPGAGQHKGAQARARPLDALERESLP